MDSHGTNEGALWGGRFAGGPADAMFALGLAYEYANGVRYDIATAGEWYDKACKHGLQKGCEASARLKR